MTKQNKPEVIQVEETYWTPFTEFSRTEGNLLKKWQEHYHRQGIRTLVKDQKLWVNLADDMRVYPREITTA